MNPMASLRFHQASPAAWLEFSGEDSPEFLQSQFSNDLRSIGTGGVYGLWLDHKGRIQADSVVFQSGPEHFQAMSYHAPAALIRETLTGRIVADEVEIVDRTDEVILFSTWGGDPAMADLPTSGCRQTATRRTRDPGHDFIVPAGEADAWRQRLVDSTAEEADPGEIERLRIANGIPRIPVDAGPADLPQEAGLESECVSYRKGCFIGQEVMARLHNLGRPTRCLARVRGYGEIPRCPAAMTDRNQRTQGELRSAVALQDSWMGLAIVRNRALDEELWVASDRIEMEVVS